MRVKRRKPSDDAMRLSTHTGEDVAVEDGQPHRRGGNPFMGIGGYMLLIIVLVMVLVFGSIVSLCLGQYSISLDQARGIVLSTFMDVEKTWNSQAEGVIYTLRLPRILGALLVGGALALAGSSFQGVFKNPLVSPDLLGVSSGACVGASIGILLHLSSVEVQLLAFVLGLVTVFCTVSIPKLLRNSSMAMMVLAGVIMSGVMASLLGMIKYLADPETELAAITYWQLGSLSKVTVADLSSIAPIIVLAASIVLAIRWRINILSLGDNEARTLGVNTRRTRGVVILCSTLLTASSVCVCGTIGWVGLVIPHVSRMLVGPDNVRSMPVCVLLGAAFMLLIDTIARVLTSMDLPLGMLIGLVGAPFFLFVLVKQRMNLS